MHVPVDVMLLAAAGISAPCVDFAWRPISFGPYTAERAAIIIPITVEGVGEALPFQLDTGSARSEIYADENAPLTARQVRVSGASWPAREIALAEPGPRPADPGEPVGTAGVDLFPDGFVLRLAARQLCPLSPQDWAWHPMRRVNGSPVIVVEDDGQTVNLLLDTGSAAFSILSTPALSRGIAQAEPVRTLTVPSFGRELTVRELRPVTPFRVFGQPLAPERVYAFADADIEKMLRSAGIEGLIGLSAFDGELAFDFAGERIAYRQKPQP